MTVHKSAAMAVAMSLACAWSAPSHAEVIDSAIPWVTQSGSSHTIIVAPADIAGFDARENATVQVQGGEVSGLSTHDSSRALVSGGEVSWLRLYENSHADLTGGQLSWIWLHDHSTVRITGLTDLSWLVFDDTTTRAEIVADNVSYSGGHLSGTWANGQAFSFWAVDAGFSPTSVMPSSIFITAVPEPSAWAMGLIGMVGLLTWRSRQGHHPQRALARDALGA